MLPLLALLVSCGGGLGSTTTTMTTTTTPTLVSIAVTPADSSVTVGTSLQYTATGTYSDGKTAAITDATWSPAGTKVTMATRWRR